MLGSDRNSFQSFSHKQDLLAKKKKAIAVEIRELETDHGQLTPAPEKAGPRETRAGCVVSAPLPLGGPRPRARAPAAPPTRAGRAPTEAPSTRGRAETRLPSPFATAAELKARQRDAWEASSGLAEGERRAAGPLSHEDKGQERGRPPPAPSRRPSRGRRIKPSRRTGALEKNVASAFGS